MKKKLYKSDTDKVLGGIIGGLGEYMDIDPTMLRLAYLLIGIATGVFPAVIAYIIAMMIVPSKPVVVHVNHTETQTHAKAPSHEAKHEEKVENNKEETKENPIV